MSKQVNKIVVYLVTYHKQTLNFFKLRSEAKSIRHLSVLHRYQKGGVAVIFYLFHFCTKKENILLVRYCSDQSLNLYFNTLRRQVSLTKVVSYCLNANFRAIKGIVSRDFVVCFLVSFDRSDISTHQEQVLLLLKVRFRIEFFDFCVKYR
jgi:hypothetical protein